MQNSLLTKIKRRLRLTLPYNPKTFWNLYSQEFTQDQFQHQIFSQHHWLLDQIKTINPQTILEAGSGFGRNLNLISPHLKSSQSLVGIDISLNLLQKSLRKNPQINHIQANLHHLPFAPNSFDLVFTHGVLMHQAPSHITISLKELIQTSKKHLILIEEIRPMPRQINHYTFAHNYPHLLKKHHLKIASQSTDEKNLILIHATK